MLNLLVTLPLQFACQLIGPGNSSNGNFTIIENISAPSQQPAQQGEDIGVAYKFYETAKTWNEARKSCIAEGATLAVLDSVQKIRSAKTILRKFSVFHVGIHKTYDHTEWTSVRTGLAVSSLPWESGEDVDSDSPDCVYVDLVSNGLIPCRCDISLYYICEIEIPDDTRDGR